MNNNESIVIRSPDPANIYCYTPGICVLPNGRIIATVDYGGSGVGNMPGEKYAPWKGFWHQGVILISDDHGKSWKETAKFPFMHARPFTAGKSVYILGHADDLMIMRSDDKGKTWKPPVKLTDGEFWHQSACNVHYANGCVYLVMEKRTSFKIRTWYIGECSPVLMRGRTDKDLTKVKNWEFSSSFSFRDIFPKGKYPDYFGIPFFEEKYPDASYPAPGRECAPMGWLETNVVQVKDKNHYWHDPSGRTYHLWMRAHTGGTGYACIIKVKELGNKPGTGKMKSSFETVPSGSKMLFVPCPGGQMRFHVLYDEKTKLYWLLSTQATDSMTRTERLPKDRYNLPNNERRRLQLHFSKNMIDWCFAGIVAIGPKSEKASRHYASMAISGDDLLVLARSGDEKASSAHNGNLITFHKVKNFRKLIY